MLNENMKVECYYCHKLLEKSKMTQDHVVPLSRGGSDDESNKKLSCYCCNHEKDNMTYEEYMQFLKLAGHLSGLNREILNHYFILKTEISTKIMLNNESEENKIKYLNSWKMRVNAIACMIPYLIKDLTIDEDIICECTGSKEYKKLIRRQIKHHKKHYQE